MLTFVSFAMLQNWEHTCQSPLSSCCLCSVFVVWSPPPPNFPFLVETLCNDHSMDIFHCYFELRTCDFELRTRCPRCKSLQYCWMYIKYQVSYYLKVHLSVEVTALSIEPAVPGVMKPLVLLSVHISKSLVTSKYIEEISWINLLVRS